MFTFKTGTESLKKISKKTGLKTLSSDIIFSSYGPLRAFSFKIQTPSLNLSSHHSIPVPNNNYCVSHAFICKRTDV